MFSLICALNIGWVNSREAVDLRRHRTHYEVTVSGIFEMWLQLQMCKFEIFVVDVLNMSFDITPGCLSQDLADDKSASWQWLGATRQQVITETFLAKFYGDY